eukprot:TRINITY_DN9993_c0_g1_i2.p1 TRINITY_DN9993_c0_g1~~TRINITY_DN9993_c0_g1_i2.p1  ORF type:complete len:721 (+),score=246.86 TRINITY_DN9993_c0_g1_i2:50-2164(+)
MGCCWSKKEGVLLEDEVLRNIGKNVTTVHVGAFEQPLKPIGTSGGTAAFFPMVYKNDRVPKGMTRDYWIGKDLAHASDELDFYEKTLKLRRTEKDKWPIFQFMFDYGGVAEIGCLVDGRVEVRKQLLLKNIMEGTTRLRLIDIKIGAVTGVGGWQGKSHIHAMKNKVVDHTTNSHIEGFRAEGFDKPPEALETLLAADSQNKIPGRQGGKKLALQRLPASEFLTYFCLMEGNDGTHETYSGLEVGMIAVQQCVKKLITILSAAAVMPIPQQWIGSSVALAFDTAARPRREARLPDLARVHLFDWGRSELTTEDMYKILGPHQQRARASHWAEWVGGMLRLAFEVCRFYRRQYCPKNRWVSIRFKVWSHARNNDLQNTVSGTKIGVASIDLRDVKGAVERDLELEGPDGLDNLIRGAVILKTVGLTTNAVKQKVGMSPKGSSSKAVIRVKVEQVNNLINGCFNDVWMVHVMHATNLPKTDVVGWCNPVVTVCLVDEVGAEARLRTRIIRNTSDPAWNEKLYFGSAKEEHRRSTVLLPNAYHPRAPGETITDWDLAAGPGGNYKTALRLFRDLYFHGDTGMSMEERDELKDDMLNKTLANEVDTEMARELEATKKLLEEEMRRSEALEDELRQLKMTPLSSMSSALPATPLTPVTPVNHMQTRKVTGTDRSHGRGRAHPPRPSFIEPLTMTWPAPMGRGRAYVFST